VKEPAKTGNPEFSVDRIVARMKAASERRGLAADVASSETVAEAKFGSARLQDAPLGEIDIHPLTLQPPFYPESNGRYHVNDLLKYHDRKFIQNAYRAILKRGPDAAGYKTFLESLRSAQLNKIDILARLRYSAEGRAKQVEIEGLLAPAMIRKAYRLPVVGYLLNLAVALARLPTTIRSEQRFEAHVLAQQEMIAEHLNHLGRMLLAHAAGVSQALQQQVADNRERNDQTALRVDQAERRLSQIQQQLDHTQQQLSQLLTAVQQQIDELAQRQEQLTEHFQGYAGQIESRLVEVTDLFEVRINELKLKLDDEARQRQQELQSLGKQIGETTSSWREEFKTLEARLEQWRKEVRGVETEFRQMDARQREQIESNAQDLKREVNRIFEKQQQAGAELVLQGQRLSVVLEEARKRLPAPFDETQLRAIAKEQDHTLDAFYASFDEQFRGSRREIKERLRVYLPIIKQHGIGTEGKPVLDVGCGRGEWLELLQEQGLQATGVDSNRVLVEQCKDRGLNVREVDLNTYLSSLEDSSLGAVSGFHIVEHLPLETLVEFLNQTVRVLQPGGAVIFETPNPQNVLVGSCNFYFDPTHRNPLPSQVMSFLLESRGFVRVKVLHLNPSDDTPVMDDSELARRFNQYFYGPMDYAVVGWKV
jgi:2-polyprenyl-3-methyl-5-hydroxy-6-metoxy-1,4-benzoquinol methylase